MKRFIFIFAIFVISVSTFGQDFKTIREGVEYAELTRGTKEEPIHMNLLKLDLKKVRLDVVHAMDAAIGVEKTSSIAMRHNAIAAINAGFFRLDSSDFAGEAAGVLMIDHVLLSESVNRRIALAIINEKKKSKVVFDRVNAEVVMIWSQNLQTKLSGVDRERKHNSELLLYTPDISETPKTADGIYEIVLSDCRFGCAKTVVGRSNGGTKIPKDGYIVSLPRNKDTEYLIDYLTAKGTKNGKERLIFFGFFSEGDPKKRKDLEKAEDVTNGVGQLIRDGKIEITWQEEKASKSFAESKHPRTAVAKLKDGKFLMVTVDGRQPGYSVGMTLQELAEFLKEVGAVDAMNLDGGGSTTMFLDGKVVNKPSDKDGERRIGDAILVTLRKAK